MRATGIGEKEEENIVYEGRAANSTVSEVFHIKIFVSPALHNLRKLTQ
jgi:hypothetical protein